MKKTLFVLTLLCMSIMVYAQDNDEHLTFKGIPINGTMNSFVAKLKQKGDATNHQKSMSEAMDDL